MASSAAYRELRARVNQALSDAPGRDAYELVLEGRMQLFSVLQLCELLVLLYAPWWWLKVAAAGLFGIYRARAIWTVVHERVHRKELPNTPAKLFFDFCTVFVVRWWRMHHLRHHAHTNTDKDPDTKMFLWRDLNDVRRPPRSLPRRAAGFAATLAQLPFLFVLFLYRSLSTYKEGSAAVYLALIASYGLLMSALLPPDEATLNTASNFFLGASYVVLTFAPTHAATPANFALVGDPLVDQLSATNNVWPRSASWSHFCGGINLHIEHHLFPGLPYDQLLRIVPVVEAFAREQGLPYHSWSPLGIWRAHLAFLWRT